MTENQQANLQQVMAFIRLSVVLAYMRRAEDLTDEGSDHNHPEQKWFATFENEVDVQSIFLRNSVDPDGPASDVLKVWFRRAAPSEVWARWFSGKALSEKNLQQLNRKSRAESEQRSGKAFAILPSLHQLKPFTADAYPHNMVARFKSFLAATDEDRKSGRDHGEPTHHLLRWGDYALEMVELNGGWRQFAHRASRGLQYLDDYWPSRERPRAATPAAGSNSFFRRVRALARDRYIQIIVPPTAVAWPLWLLRILHGEKTDRDATGERLVRKMKEVRKHGDGPLRLKTLLDGGADGNPLFLDLSLRPGELRGLPYPFGEAESALERVRGALGIAQPDHNTVWELEWFTPLCNQLFPKRDRVQGCPPILIFHRSDAQGAGMSRYILATEPCQKFATVFEVGTIQRNNYFVCCQSGTWAEGPAKKINATAKFIVHRDKFLAKCQSLDQEKGNGLFLSSFPSDIFLRAIKSPLKKSALYRLDLDETDLEELDYLLPGAALFGGENLVFQPKMLRLLRDFGGLLIECARVIRACIPGLSLDNASAYVCVDPAKRIEQANALASNCSAKMQALLPANDRAHDFIKTLLTCIGLEIGLHLIPENLREEYNDYMEQWGWAHLLQLTFYTNVSFGEALALTEE